MERKNEFGSNLLNLDLFIEKADPYSIEIFPPEQIDGIKNHLIQSTKKPPEGSIQLKMKKEELNDKLLLAGSFYTSWIKSWLATGSDAYKPTYDDVLKFCRKLSEDGIDLVFYYAFSKTASPQRTGSPDWIIDFAEFEMLKHWVLTAKIAESLGFNLRIVLVDESTALPYDDILGFKPSDYETNQKLLRSYLEKTGSTHQILYRPLIDSVKIPLGDEFHKLYEKKLEEANNLLSEQINLEKITPEIIRIATFLDVLPGSTLTLYGLDQTEIDHIFSSLKEGNFEPLLTIDQDLLAYLINLTAHFKAIMDLRNFAASRVNHTGLDSFPEYNPNRIYGGVTRSTNRWSFLPHPKKFNGQTVNPMHGLAVYNKNGGFLGICQKRNLPPESNIIYEGQKPLFVII